MRASDSAQDFCLGRTGWAGKTMFTVQKHVQYLFVGERRSPLAIQRRVTWQDGKLAAKTLCEALSAAGIPRRNYEMLNLWEDDGTLSALAEQTVRDCHEAGWIVVGMGRKVQKRLQICGIPHRALTHPAARGALRKREHYQAHVQAVLT